MAIRVVKIVAKFLTHFRRVLRLAPVILETFGLSGMKRERWKGAELAYDETVMLSVVSLVFHEGGRYWVSPFEKGGLERDLNARFFPMNTPQSSWERSLLFTLHIH